MHCELHAGREDQLGGNKRKERKDGDQGVETSSGDRKELLGGNGLAMGKTRG